MMNARDTHYVLERFFDKCFEYWINEWSVHDNDRKAFKLALEDIKATNHNPFSPQGEELDQVAKAEFIKMREEDLGGNE